MSEGFPNPIKIDAGQQFAVADTVDELLESTAPNQLALLNIFAVADLHDVDPVPLIMGLAEELSAGDKSRVTELAEKMTAGADAADAIEQMPSLLPPSCVLAIRLARDDGTLSALYAALLARYHGNEPEKFRCDEHYVSILARLAGRVSAILLIISFIMLKIVPEFQKMMEEFQVEPPQVFYLLMRVCDTMVNFWFVPFVLMLCSLPFCIAFVQGYFRRWRPLKWRQRTFSSAVNRRRSLALVTQGSTSLKSRIATALTSASLKRNLPRFFRASSRIEDGQDAWKSLAAEKVISKREAKALSMTLSGDTQAWLLRWSAADQQHRQATRGSFLLNLFVVTTNIALALMVVLTCVAVFMTYIQIAASTQ